MDESPTLGLNATSGTNPPVHFFLNWCLAARETGLRVIHHDHETIVHMQLLVAMEECRSGIVRHKINFRAAETRDGDHILHHSGRALSRDIDQFKAMPVQMNDVRHRCCCETRGGIAGLRVPAGALHREMICR